ncbi:MAG: quinol:electron acceptor oxidoreductase subunit ActD [Pirellulaceae bacterium]
MAESSSETSKTRGVVAEYDTPEALIAAANRVREAGFTKTDAFSPFPVHGIDEAIGIKPTILPWIVLTAGTIGCITGLTMEVWMNAISYPYIISGKPYISLPAFIPVSFELTILFSAFAAFFGQWFLNGLPKFSNPMFTSPKFDAATDDKFFLFIDARDKRFDDKGARALLGDTSPLSVDDVIDDPSPASMPKAIYLVVIALAVLSVFPLLVIANMRVTKSSSPRFHIFWDMDFMPYKEAQEATILFRDGRAMRPPVPGTVMRDDSNLQLDYQLGIQLDELAKIDADRATRLVNLVQNPDAQAAAAEQPAAPEEVVDNTPWVTDNPLPINLETLSLGRQKFEIYCAVCHGRDGFGNGLVNQRAQKILATTWSQPSSLHEDRLLEGKMADGKLFNTISNGIRKMPGYASQIPVADRWAIVAYVRVLQASRNASADQLPADRRSKLVREAEVLKRKLEAEEAERQKKAAEAAAASDVPAKEAEGVVPDTAEPKAPEAEKESAAAGEADGKPAAADAEEKPASDAPAGDAPSDPKSDDAAGGDEKKTEEKPTTEDEAKPSDDAKEDSDGGSQATEQAEEKAAEEKPVVEEVDGDSEDEDATEADN